ncbi:MAG: diphthamide synthesis protein [Nanoarchaeota archaeon]|nr:diphthamide synthesis protein [Nanoarchaeota archaeon]
MNKTFQEISKEYDFKIDKLVGEIKKKNAKRVVLQFPDGLKPYAIVISEEIEKKVKNVELFIWMDSCFGGCDVPSEIDDVDLVVQFGHSEWKY